jgi:hypothetical protein
MNVERRAELRTRRMPRMSPCSTRRFQCDVLHCSRLLLVLMEFADLPREMDSVAQGDIARGVPVQVLFRG